jgi:hypothetical protein
VFEIISDEQARQIDKQLGGKPANSNTGPKS